MENIKTISDKYGNSSSSQRCITCKDSWVCGECYYKWLLINGETDSFNTTMPCVICKRDMDYSYLVEHFIGSGGDDGWWQHILPHFSDKLSDLLEKNMEM